MMLPMMSQSSPAPASIGSSYFLYGRPFLARVASMMRWLRLSFLAASASFLALAIRIRASSVDSSRPDEAWPAGPSDGAWTLMKDG